MVAEEPTVVPVYIPLLVASLPVILSPIVVWALGRSRISKELATIDYLNKRLDFLERLNKLRTQLAEGPIRPFLDTEIERAEAFLRQPRTFAPRSAEMEVAAPQSRFGSVLSHPARRVHAQARFQRALLFLLWSRSAFPAVRTNLAAFRAVSRRLAVYHRVWLWLSLLPCHCSSVSPRGALMASARTTACLQIGTNRTYGGRFDDVRSARENRKLADCH
jgi:hypothetical protein